MNQYKICVYAICKNEEKFVDRWMDSISEADMIIVNDTGSTDKTVEKLRARGAVVYTDAINPWRFDTARNVAMDHIPDDVDICVSIDLDEIFEKGWRQRLEDAWNPSYTYAKYLYTYSYHSDGTPDKQFVREKIHCRHGFRWVHPVHEELVYNGDKINNSVWVDGLVLNHHPDNAKPRSQYLPLLELSAQENPNDDRTAFWLGREYMYYGQFDKSIETLKNHLKMPSAIWDEERCASMRFIAKCYQNKQNLHESRIWLYKAIAECPQIREPYYDMAMLGYLEQDWSLVYLCVTDALKITQKSGSYLLELVAWSESIYDLGAISCYWLGMYQKSYDYAMQACEIAPNDNRLKQNLELIKQKL